MPRKNLVGQKFGLLTVLEPFESTTDKGDIRAQWKCLCECGNEKITTTNRLTNGLTSCGCRKGGLLANTEAGLNNMYSMYKGDSARRKVKEFLLTKDEFKQLTSSNCYYCGCLPQRQVKAFSKKSSPYICNGIDRIDSDKGYTLDNCRPACWICNRAKRELTDSEFSSWIARLVDYQINKGVEVE